MLLDPSVAGTIRPYLTTNAAILEVTPEGGPSDAQSLDLVRTLRAGARTHSEGAFTVQVGAEVASNVDLIDHIQGRAPWTVAIVVVLTWLALFARFRSLLIPTKAVILNLLSLGASFGMLVWIFQEGHLAGLLRFEPLDYTILLVPIIMFCFMFGLSMDYEVVMLSRIHEAWQATGDNTRAIDEGLRTSAGIVTSGALIMLVVFCAFGTGELPFVKQVGVGMALAVIIDTTVIRMVLLPSTMRLAGRWNWWAPGGRG
jgi:RND superfamily putative drug exporter